MAMHTLSHLTNLHAISETPFFIFGVAPYAPEHEEKLNALAQQCGAGFLTCDGGGCFVAHRDAIAMHADYVAEILTEAFNHGLLPQ